MIEFDIKTIYGGWELTWLPDDIVIVVRTHEQQNRISSSLRELLEVYGHIRNRKNGRVAIGTGSIISVEFEEDDVYFESPPVNIQIPAYKLQEEFEEALSKIFIEKDKKDPGNRNEHLDITQNKLVKWGVDYDVFELYEELSN